MRRVVVVGGGIAGLATAYYLRKTSAKASLPLSCTLIEGESTLGGKVVTKRRDGFVVEGGPDSFLTQKPWALALCRELGLSDRLIGAGRDGRPLGVSILSRGRLVPLPEGMPLIAPTRLWPFATSRLFSLSGKLRIGMDLVLPGRASEMDESLASFVRRRLGQEALDKVAEPLLAGIHVADPERLSLEATFPRFADLERKHGSLIRGSLAAKKAARSLQLSENGKRPPPAFASLRGGMSELVDALASHLDGISIVAGHRAVCLDRDARDETMASDTDVYRIRLDDATAIAADAVVLAVPAYVAADLVTSLSPTLAAEPWRIRYVSTATVSLGYDRRQLGRPLAGSGFLVPRREKRTISACTWSSAKFEGRASEGRILVRAFVGGSGDEQLVDLDDASLVSAIREELRSIVGIVGEPLISEVFRFRRGMPQYDVGHLDRVSALERQAPRGLFLTGSAYRGVGLPDCVRAAETTAAEALKYLSPSVA